MDDKTGIFTFTGTIDKSHDGEITKGRVQREKDRMLRQSQYQIGERMDPGKMYVVAMTPLHEGDRLLTIDLGIKVLIALSNWTDAEIGDCVVWDGDDMLAREVVPGEIWHFAPYGIFPALGRFSEGKTHLKIFQRVD